MLSERFAPRITVMATGVLDAVSTVVKVLYKRMPRLDPFADDPDERDPPTGWCKVVPRCLRAFAVVDVATVLLLLKSAGVSCDVPLKAWLVGGLLLGFPASAYVSRVATNRPSFRFYRLTVAALRDGGDPAGAKLEGLVLYDQFGLPIERAYVQEQQDGAMWFGTLNRQGAELITGYQLVTHRSASAGSDPVSWVLEGSFDGVIWQLMDEVDGPVIPLGRGVATALFEDLLHLEEATSAFRSAFLVEVAAGALAFAWLVAGTSWVSQGTETCVDSAPLLWYSCYLIVVLAWSFLGTVTIGLIISAVAMIVLGVKSGSRN